jgi:hypothetical protein
VLFILYSLTGWVVKTRGCGDGLVGVEVVKDATPIDCWTTFFQGEGWDAGSMWGLHREFQVGPALLGLARDFFEIERRGSLL